MLGLQPDLGTPVCVPHAPVPHRSSTDQPLLFLTAESFKEFAELLHEVELERSMMVR